MLVIDPNEYDLAHETELCNVMIIDSVDTDCFQLKRILKELDCDILPFKANDDIQEIIQLNKPELIFYNIEKSIEADEYLLRSIKQCHSERAPSPYIILTISKEVSFNIELGDQNDLYDDICHKPLSESSVKARLICWKKNNIMQKVIMMQNDRINDYSNLIGQEMELASNIINNLVRGKWLSPGNTRHIQFPMELLSGDIYLCAFNPAGQQILLIGDLTGHGLAAAVGAMVVYDIFYSMVRKGFKLDLIAKEINTKLSRTLNTGRFMCACLIELNNRKHFMQVLNAGLPDVLIRGDKASIKDRLQSDNVPFGVIPSSRLDLNIRQVSLDQGDRIYIYSDGLNEVHNKEGDILGNQRIYKLFTEEQDGDNLFDAILNLMYQFHGGGKRTDDITLVEIICDDDLLDKDSISCNEQMEKPPMHWSIAVDMGADLLKRENPLPLLLHNTVELQGLQAHRELIYTVLAEMFSNALEHGLLRLDSGLKNDPDGFSNYYRMRDKLLESLEQGHIRMELMNEPCGDRAKLTIALHHDGEGFDFKSCLDEIDKGGYQPHGRGIKLIQNICDDIRYLDNGRRMEADYYWKK